MNNVPRFCVIHGNDPIRYLRSVDVIDALREIRIRGVRDWGWSVPSNFNLDRDCCENGLLLVVNATLTDSGILVD